MITSANPCRKHVFWVLLLLLLRPGLLQAESSVGIGAGIPYGFIGLNLNYSVSDHFDLTFGLGQTLFAGSGKAVGLRYYPNPTESGLRFSLIYGTNAIVREDDCILIFCDGESSHEGFNLGIGWASQEAHRGWEFDIMLLLNSEAEDRIDELQARGDDIDDLDFPELKIAFGYHWR